jgi:hypothetical protein
VNVLDENVTRDQADLLRQWGIRFRSISRDFHRQGIHDDNIVPFLLRLKQPTLLTRDGDFFERRLVHGRYCLAWFEVDSSQTAFFIRRFLSHPRFRTNAQRLGKVICIAPRGVEYWSKSAEQLIEVCWP